MTISTTSTISQVGIIGAGQMGAGIAHVFAIAGFDVVLNDISTESLTNASNTIAANLDRQIKKELITETDKIAAIARIATEQDQTAFAECGLVIEAATENEATKIAIFNALRDHLSPTAIVATNTSAISITRLAIASGRPDRFVGLHFMNPVPVMELVELIRGIATSDATFSAVESVISRLNKTVAIVEDSPAFLVNRILVPMINEAIFALYEGVGSVTSIDAAMKLGAHHPMGPLQLADLIGLDTCLAIMKVLNSGFSDPKYRPCPLLVKYVDAGWLGRKSGRGFYDYSGDSPIPVS